MKRFFFVLVAALFASGCASRTVIEGDSPAARADNAIAQAEIVLTKGYRAITDQVAQGVLLKSELQAALGALDKAAAVVDEAKALRAKGAYADALNKVLDANTDQALAFVEAEIAKRLKERRAQPVVYQLMAIPKALPEGQARAKCGEEILDFLGVYRQLKDVQHWTEEQIAGSIVGHPRAIAAAQEFTHADFKNDLSAARAALDHLFEVCVAVRMNPEVTI